MADEAFALAQDPATVRRDAWVRHPVGRVGNPADVANSVAWLASDEATFVSGQFFTSTVA